jgi:hypothetical protein
MKVLEIDDVGAVFVVSTEKRVRVLKITDTDIYTMLDNIFSNHEYYNFEDSSESIEQIHNPVEKEMAIQIIKQLITFSNQAESLKSDLDTEFPMLDDFSNLE